MLAVLGFLSFALALAASRLLYARFGRFALDQPNERSLHERPVPRTGGIAVLAGTAVSLAFGAARFGCRWRSRWPCRDLVPRRPAGLADGCAAGRASRCGDALLWYVLSPMYFVEMVVLVLAVVWITNLYNFMDGSDGLAGGMAMIGFGAYGVAAWWAADAALAALCLALSAAAARVPAAQPPSGADFSRRRRLDPARLPRRRARHRRLAQRPLAALVPGAGLRAVHRRRHDHARAACCCGASASGRRTATTTTSGWCAWGSATAARRGSAMRSCCSAPALRLLGRGQPPLMQATVFLGDQRHARRDGDLGRRALAALLARAADRHEAAPPDRLRARRARGGHRLDRRLLAALQFRTADRLSGADAGARCRGCSASTPRYSGCSGSTGGFGAMPACPICSASP